MSVIELHMNEWNVILLESGLDIMHTPLHDLISGSLYLNFKYDIDFWN